MRFPYGIADFHMISADGLFYIDRTDRIPLVEQAGYQLLLLRPRRFGKSLWLSTLENYYDIAKADLFESLFGKLKIGQNPTPRRNQYFILRWDFSVVDPQGDTESIRRALHGHLNGCFEEFIARYQGRLGHRIEIHPEDALRSFQSVLAAVRQTPHKLYLLVDEYDNFANEVLVSRERGEARYRELVGGEGVIKTLFKAVKSAAGLGGLERIFMTGVTPVVLADITSGFNVVKDITLRGGLDDLCGFHEEEVRATLDRIAIECELPPGKVAEALGLMRTFYNGYNFSLREERGTVYNPTLALYFFEKFAEECRYPEEMLDGNLAMDRNRIQYVARLPHGQNLIAEALNPESAIAIDRLSDRFGVEMMLKTPQDHGFLGSLLYYFGVLTYAGRDPMGKLRLRIPNLVVRKLYAEQIREALLPGYEVNEERQAAANRFYAEGDPEPLCDFIERRYLPVFDNRDLRWTNELVVKTAFLTCLFNDLAYIMDSETVIDKGYADLTLIVRPDMRQYTLLDHLLEFKALKIGDIPGASHESLVDMPRGELCAIPAVAKLLDQAESQLARYRTTLEQVYGPKLRLCTRAVVCIGLSRLVWR